MIALRAAAAATLCLLASAPAFAGGQEDRRALRIDDVFDMEGIGHGYGGPFAFSPDDPSLAFTHLRPRRTLKNHQQEYLLSNERGDVWLQARPGAPAVNLTAAAGDTGWWAPQWSPDGRWLAMLSVREGRVTLWAWEKSSATLAQRSTLEVDLRDYDRPPFVWVGSGKILFPAKSAGVPPEVIESDLQATPRIATAAWRKAARGEVATASTLDSGSSRTAAGQPGSRLMLLDVATGEIRTILDQATSDWSLSPRGNAIAFARQDGVYLPKPGESLPLGRITPTPALGQYSVEIHFLDGKSAIPSATSSRDVRTGSMRWSPGGHELAFLGSGESRLQPAKLFRVDVATHRVRTVDLGALDPVPADRLRIGLEWTSTGEILLLAARRGAHVRAPVTARRDWWLLHADGRQRCLTGEMSNPPRELWAGEGRKDFFGVTDGTLWRLRPGDTSIVNLSASLDGAVDGIDWPRTVSWDDSAEFHRSGGTFPEILFSLRRQKILAYYRLATASGKVTPLEMPDSTARLAAYDPRTNSAVFVAANGNGTFVWRVQSAPSRTDVLMQANTFLRNVAGGELRSLSYTSQEGEALNGWLILPYGYEAGKRYPLLTWVHGGFIAGPEPPYWHSVSYADALNMHIPAARGYAVLLPSMPVRMPGDADEVLLGLGNGVLPAIDKAIELGIVDGERLFVGGHSFGGYATYGLMAQTRRFKAAVALAGATNLVSQYGSFDPRLRYGRAPHENLTNVTRMEVGQSNLGSAPWEDLGRYLRNSPISYVGSMSTPVLIVQGDLDFVPLQQGEELFMSLYRQGKRAQFVRYWGEGHELRSPANVRDMWSRVFAWLDEFGDIARGADGRILFDGEKPRSRGGTPGWTPERFLESERSP